MRPLRRDDVFAIAVTVLLLAPVIVGGAALLWFSCARYGVGSIGLLLAIAWAYLWTGILIKVVREILKPEIPSRAAFRQLRDKSPAIENYFYEQRVSR